MFALLCAAALAKEAPKVQISPRGEVRLDLQATDLETVGAEALGDPGLAFRLERTFLGFDVNYGSRVSALVQLDINQNFATEVKPGGSSGLTFEDTTSLRMMDAWVQTDTKVGQFRLGQQFLAFGNVDSFTGNRPHYIPGPTSFQDGPRRLRVLPNRILGVTWKAQVGHITTTTQVSSVASAHELETEFGKNLTFRAAYGLPEIGLHFAASGLVGPGDGEGTHVMYDALVNWSLGRNHAFAEFFGGQGLGTQHMGAVGGYAHGIPMDRQELDRLNLVGRVSWFDADMEDADTELVFEGASNLWWGPYDGGAIMSGFGWQTRLPSDISLPIEHRGTLQLLFQF